MLNYFPAKDRRHRACDRQAGSKAATDRIRAKLKKILARHTPPPLPDGAAEKIAAILREAEARGAKR
jgi:trimethylamine:corrinoid methyltransferase-like protein